MSDVENETQVDEAEETPEPTKPFHVYKQNDRGHLEYKGVFETADWRPSVKMLGDAYGDGKYVVLDDNTQYPHHVSGYRVEIISETWFSEKFED